MNPKTELEPKILEDKEESAVRRWLNARASFVVAVAFVLFAARLFHLISKYAVNIFFSDQWEFNDATLFQKHTIWQMFAWQHGQHRQGLSALFSKLVEPHLGWNFSLACSLQSCSSWTTGLTLLSLGYQESGSQAPYSFLSRRWDPSLSDTGSLRTYRVSPLGRRRSDHMWASWG